VPPDAKVTVRVLDALTGRGAEKAQHALRKDEMPATSPGFTGRGKPLQS